MGCKDYNINPLNGELSLVTGSTVAIITPEGDVKTVLLYKKDLSNRGNYIIKTGGKEISVPTKRIFMYEALAHRSLLACEIEQNIPTLLENALVSDYSTDIKRKKLENNRWNKFIEKLIIVLKRLKIK